MWRWQSHQERRWLLRQGDKTASQGPNHEEPAKQSPEGRAAGSGPSKEAGAPSVCLRDKLLGWSRVDRKVSEEAELSVERWVGATRGGG